MIKINTEIKPADLASKLRRFWQLSDQKIHLIEDQYDESKGSPVFTINGKYSTRGWTEWTQGFQYGSAILQFDATGDFKMLETARLKTLELSYNLPENLLSKVKISALRVYVNGNNLFTIDKLKWVDPENIEQNGSFYPQSKIYNFGINISF